MQQVHVQALGLVPVAKFSALISLDNLINGLYTKSDMEIMYFTDKFCFLVSASFRSSLSNLLL